MRFLTAIFRAPDGALIATATCLILMILFGEALSQESIIVSPQITELELAPGQQRVFEVVVGNASEATPIVCQIGISPITQNERGDYKVTRTEDQWSCASWITVDKTTISLAPGQWQQIRCEIRAPYVAAGGRYAAVTVAFGDRSSASAPMSTSFEYMLGSYVEVTMIRGRVTRKADIENLEIMPVRGNKTLEDQFGKDAFFMTADVTNSGNIGVVAKATLRLRRHTGLIRREVPLGAGRGMVLPGTTVKYRSLFKTKPPAGVYTAEASLGYGGYKPAITKMVFSITQDGEIEPGKVEMVETVGLGVTPAKFDLRAAPGSRKTVGATIHNVEDRPVRIVTRKLPLVQESDGRLVTKLDAKVQSCHEWIDIEPDSLEVAANTRRRVRVTIIVPKDAQGSAYSRLAFLPLDTEASEESMEESYSTDIFLNLVPGAQTGVEISSFSAGAAGRFQPIESVVKVKNTGNCYVDIDASIQISDARGPTVRELQLTDRDTRVLPGVTRTFTITDQQGLESGTYNAELTLRIGKERVGYSQHTFTIRE